MTGTERDQDYGRVGTEEEDESDVDKFLARKIGSGQDKLGEDKVIDELILSQINDLNNQIQDDESSN